MSGAGRLIAEAEGLDAAGRTDAARAAYVSALVAAPDDAAALHGLGAHLSRTGARRAAQIVYARLCGCFPDDAAARVGLANLLHEAGDAAAAFAHYRRALQADPGCPEAHQGLGNVCAARGDHAAAQAHWMLGYRDRVFHRWAYRGAGTPLRVLLLISAAGGNVRAASFLDDTVFAVTVVVAAYCTDAQDLPAHDVIVNAIGDADLCAVDLVAADAICARSTAPVINAPGAVLRTGRMDNAVRLARIDGVVTPRMARVEDLASLGGLGFDFPFLLRSPGCHTGQHFVRVDQAAGVVPGLLPEGPVFAMQYFAPDHADGLARKGRVMVIGGQLYPLHWAISRAWKVHYFTAEMAGSDAHRAEEAQFLADMPGFLGGAAMIALAAIGAMLGLEYGGIDFVVRADGRVLVFEANATMVILEPPLGAMWDYRRRAVAHARDAVRAMLRGTAHGVIPPGGCLPVSPGTGPSNILPTPNPAPISCAS